MQLRNGSRNVGCEYILNDTPLAQTKEEKDLGVWTTNTLKSDKQCQAAANKTTSLLKLSFHRPNHFSCYCTSLM